jgi:hypothetical protein
VTVRLEAISPSYESLREMFLSRAGTTWETATTVSMTASEASTATSMIIGSDLDVDDAADGEEAE